MDDIPNLVHFNHSGNTVINIVPDYCSKRPSVSYEGSHARTQLAVLDHNASLNQLKATTKSGVKKVYVQWSKVTEN